MKRKVFVVPHSHWDREWYFSIEDSNTLLTENMSQLIHYLEAHPEFPTYTFDGQYSVVADYLKHSPENQARIKKLVQNNRLHIGPWYTQNDTLLVQTESIIRNLLIGKKGAETFGHSMDIGYLPDVFGQHAYLPSIFKRFGITHSVLQRGLYTEQIKDNLNFIWEAPNKESIAANNLFFGYGPGKFLADDDEYLTKTLLPILESLEKMNPEGSPLLLPAGGDQVFVRKNFPKVIEALNQKDLNYEFILSDYESFMESAGEDQQKYKTIRGELLASQKSRIHNTIRSQRVDIKLTNARVEEKIYQQLEPLGVLSQQLGGNYPQTWIHTCLTLLFDVHAHDSIGGCNSDETNQEIMNRLNKVERIVDDYLNILKKQISRGILGEEGTGVVAFNLLPKATCKKLTFTLFTKEPDVCLVGCDGQLLPQSINVQTYISGGKQVKVTADGEVEVELPGYYRSEVIAEVNFTGFGYKQLTISQQENQISQDRQTTTIANCYYEISVIEGQICLTRKSDGQRKMGLFDFENTTDAGDSYDYSPANDAKPTFSTDFIIKSVHTSAMQSEMILETTIKVAHDFQTRNELTKEQVIETSIKLITGSELIQIQHTIKNEVKDHRIRVRFLGENLTGKNYAEQGYSILERENQNPHLKNWRETGFAEAPQAIYPLERFVSVNEIAGNVTLFTKGLKEYEATQDCLSLTLFRSVGLLGKDDLAWRPGRASGINNKIVWTPNAQMQGELTFAYGYKWSPEILDIAATYQTAEEFTSHQLTYHLQALNVFEERLDRFELPQPEGLTHLPVEKTLLTIQKSVFISAFKKAEDSEATILRIFNPQHETIGLNYPLKDSESLSLDEQLLHQTTPTLKAKDYATLKIEKVGELAK